MLPEKKKIMIKNIVIDTDAANETDDQFAICYALAAKEKFNVEAFYAAPFLHYRVMSASEGMHKSYDEINTILKYFSPLKISSFRGAENFLSDGKAVENDAVCDLIKRAQSYASDNPLYVVCIASLTNLATAILLEPSIIEKIVVLWLGGELYDRPPAEFNMMQDFTATRIVFGSRVRMINFPCGGISGKLTLSLQEVKEKLPSFGDIGRFLEHRFVRHYTWSFGEYASDEQTLSIWDFAPIAFLSNPDSCKMRMISRPELLTEPIRWGTCKSGMVDNICVDIDRDAVFEDFYRKLAEVKEMSPA
jgi:inosine-uridine nucleoside N-ribohydrolase